jgi:hypothetical protein
LDGTKLSSGRQTHCDLPVLVLYSKEKNTFFRHRIVIRAFRGAFFFATASFLFIRDADGERIIMMLIAVHSYEV